MQASTRDGLWNLSQPALFDELRRDATHGVRLCHCIYRKQRHTRHIWIRSHQWQQFACDPWGIKGTNSRQKTYEVFHVYCIFYSGFMSQTTVIFGITKDGSLESNNLASWNCFTCRNLFQNGANDMSECLTFETAFCKKAKNFV